MSGPTVRLVARLHGDVTLEAVRQALLGHDRRGLSEVEGAIWRELADEGVVCDSVDLEIDGEAGSLSWLDEALNSGDGTYRP